VGSATEWDLLEEVIVGRVEGAMFPSWDRILRNTIPKNAIPDYESQFSSKGTIIPEYIVEKANIALENFIALLKSEGVKVRRPNIFDFKQPFSTPLWQVESGVSCANPRDIFLVINDCIIECPMADRGRYFEVFPYREILKDLSNSGWNWVSAPKPMLSDELYLTESTDKYPYSITEFEPTFDGADFVRCGKNIIGQTSHVTNCSGIRWLQKFLGNEYEINIIKSKCPEALHIDTTIVPLADRKLLINPEFIDSNFLPAFFDDWEIIEAPKPDSFTTQIGEYRVVSDWMSINVLSIDSKRVVVEEKQKSLIKTLRDKGFDPIPCAFEDYYIFGGSFHCATLDIYRKSNYSARIN
jgi:glycine amidinotransferase